MPLRGDLLNPIPGPHPGGADLRYDPVYDKIKEARQEDDVGPQGIWERERKTADYGFVAKVAGEVLATRSKDLQVAAWLTEALLCREGFPGLEAGLGLLRHLLDQFWDHLYPELEDGDAELRAASLEWVGRLDAPVKSAGLNTAQHNFFKYQESRDLGYEADAAGDSKKQQARQKAIEEGKLPAEEFDKGVEATPKAWYKQLMADVEGCIAALRALDAVSRERFKDAAPSYRRLEGALAEVQRAVRQLLGKKLELEPDPPEPEPVAGPSAEPALGSVPAQRSPAERSPELAGGPAAAAVATWRSSEAANREDAAARVVGAAHFLRHTEPHNPASYLLLRGFRWGELRAEGSRPNPRLLEAPPSQARTQLRGFLLDAKWAQLLEAAEMVMATPAGRGWLDLQRYALAACEGLGGDYGLVAKAVRGELKALLADIPGLVRMTLMDDLPAASPETQAWLRQQSLSNGAHPPSGAGAGGRGGGGGNGSGDAMETEQRGRPSDEALERAMGEARAGRPQKGIELLMNDLTRATSPRARFLRRTQVARIMVDAGLEAVATPILEDLLALIETHKLEDWEAGELVAQPIALLYRCIEKLDGDASLKQSLYLRVCRLDPLQAIGFTRA